MDRDMDMGYVDMVKLQLEKHRVKSVHELKDIYIYYHLSKWYSISYITQTDNSIYIFRDASNFGSPLA